MTEKSALPAPEFASTAPLAGRVAIVTGASRGIGFEIARTFVAAGARVMISSRKPERLEAACNSLGPSAAWFAANAGDEAAPGGCVGATVDRFGRLDILVNNAATNVHFGATVDITGGAADKIVHNNIVGPLLWVQAAWRAGLAEHGGSIVNIASHGGLHVEPNLGLYNASKAALIQLTRQLAAELAPAVRVNAIAPGLIRTDMSRAIWEGQETAATARTPMARIGEVADVAAAALYFASDAAGWVTGQVLGIDGGASVQGAVPRNRITSAS